MFQRLYINGKLAKSTKADAAKLRKWLDNMQAQWAEGGLRPLTLPGEFDPNQAHQIERKSVDELVIVTTGNKTLRVINVER